MAWPIHTLKLGYCLEEGSVAECLRARDLKSGGPWFKSFTVLLSGFVLGSPAARAKMSLSRPQNTFMPANIKSLVISTWVLRKIKERNE